MYIATAWHPLLPPRPQEDVVEDTADEPAASDPDAPGSGSGLDALGSRSGFGPSDLVASTSGRCAGDAADDEMAAAALESVAVAEEGGVGMLVPEHESDMAEASSSSSHRRRAGRQRRCPKLVHGQHPKLFYSQQLMSHEWMTDVPPDLGLNWYVSE